MQTVNAMTSTTNAKRAIATIIPALKPAGWLSTGSVLEVGVEVALVFEVMVDVLTTVDDVKVDAVETDVVELLVV